MRNNKIIIYVLAIAILVLRAQFAFALPEASTVSGITYVYLSNGNVNAFPSEYVTAVDDDGSVISITDKGGHRYTYSDAVVKSSAPADLPSFTSFKFNNKFNAMLMVDAEGEITSDNVISITAGGIGKRLVASFQLSDDDAVVYVGNVRQYSKVSSQRFDAPVTYTVTRSGYNMLQRQSDGSYALLPFGRDYVVKVSFLSDNPTTQYGVPVVYVTTDGGTDITSKDYYLTAKIRIDGAGYYPDLTETAMNIKGRGNMSWTDYMKRPYRIKFDKKQKPLGMKAGKNWNLIACAQTGSMMTNAVGQRMAEMVGVDAAPHFIPVELYLNGQYRGSYTFTEKVGFAGNSIDIEDESNATLLELDKFEWDFMTDALFDTLGIPVTIHYPDFSDSKDVTNLTQTEIQTHFNSFVTALRNGKDVSRYVDYPSTARYLMVNDMLVNFELMHPKSMFCYNQDIKADSLYHFGPAWDFDWCFGYETGVAHNDSNYYKWDAEADYYETKSDNLERSMFPYLLRYCGEKMDREYYRVWHDFITNHLDNLCEYCTDYYNFANRSFTHNDLTWLIDGMYDEGSQNCISWLSKRAAHVYEYLSSTLGYADKGYLDADDDPSGISNAVPSAVPTITVTKTIVNGSIVITRNGHSYNAIGMEYKRVQSR